MKHLVIITIACLLITCKDSKLKREGVADNLRQELTIYCENAMVPPLIELKRRFEAGNGCVVRLHNDCSQNLGSLIQYTQHGDIYIPASRLGFKKLIGKSNTYITDSIFIGYNSLVIMVEKGNPSSFNGNLISLTEKKHAVIIANPETSTLGYCTRDFLKEKGLYEDVILNVVALSTDSRGLVKSIKNKEAQVVINWESDVFDNGNIKYVDIFPLQDQKQSPTEIYAGILSTCTHPDLAKKFLDYATSKEGISIFRKYGFNRRKTLIF